MALTPEQVRNKLFTSVRWRQGYDEDEVDEFLDEVERELASLHAEIERLRSGPAPGPDATSEARLRQALDEARAQHEQQMAGVEARHSRELAAARSAPAGPDPARPDEPASAADERIAAANERVRAAEEQAQQLRLRIAQAQQQADAAAREAQTANAEVQRLRAAGAGEVGPPPLPPPSPTEDALRRTLLLAQRTADDAVAEARSEAQRIVTEAHRQAADAVSRVEVEHAARVRQHTLEQQQLLAKVEELRSFERDYRSRLRAYLHLQLRDLEAGVPETPPAQVTSGQRQALTGAADGGQGREGAPTDVRPSPAAPSPEAGDG